MKTFDGKNISKKEIEATLRTLDSTKIYRLFARIHGWVPERRDVYDFIQNYAPSMKVYRKAYALTWPQTHSLERNYDESLCLCRHGFYNGDKRKRVVDYLRVQVKDVTSPYAKRPMMGHTGLYFCSPIYGHSDYNKHRMIDLNGNERFCELVIKYADKFFGPVYDAK